MTSKCGRWYPMYLLYYTSTQVQSTKVHRYKSTNADAEGQAKKDAANAPLGPAAAAAAANAALLRASAPTGVCICIHTHTHTHTHIAANAALLRASAPTASASLEKGGKKGGEEDGEEGEEEEEEAGELVESGKVRASKQKLSKLLCSHKFDDSDMHRGDADLDEEVRQYLYFCTCKASKDKLSK